MTCGPSFLRPHMSFIAPSSPPFLSTASSSPFHSPFLPISFPSVSKSPSSPFHFPVRSPSFPSAGELQQYVWTHSSSSLQRSSRSSVPPSSLSMSGHSGYTYTSEGGDSIMSWPRDDASSCTNDRILAAYYAYPDYLLYDDKCAEWDADRLALKAELAAQEHIQSELELQLLAEKKKTEEVESEKIKLEMDLAYEDQVIEELDLKLEEEKKMTNQLKAEKIKLEMDLAYQRSFALAATSIAVTLFVVSVAMYAKL